MAIMAIIEEFSQLNRRQSKHLREAKLTLAEDVEQRLFQRELYIQKFAKRTELHASFERQMEIIEMLYESETYGLNISSMDVLAILGLRYGIGGDTLLPYANALHGMAKSGLVNSGGTKPLRTALRHDLVSRIHDLMYSTALSLNTLDIMKAIGLEHNVDSLSMINASLNILDILNEVIKLPKDSTHKNGNPFVWIGSQHRYSKHTIPYWNSKYVMLLVLAEEGEGFSQNDLCHDQRIATILSIRSHRGMYDGANIRSINDLIRADLVSYKIEIKGLRKTLIYKITDAGRELLALTEKKRYLDEKLRGILIGEKTIELTPLENITLQRIKRTATIYAHKKPEDTPTKLARRIGEDVLYLKEVFSRHAPIDPLRPLKKETLLIKYFPYLTEPERHGIHMYLATREKRAEA